MTSPVDWRCVKDHVGYAVNGRLYRRLTRAIVRTRYGDEYDVMAHRDGCCEACVSFD